MTRHRWQRPIRASFAALLSTGMATIPIAPAAADAPTRVGWWNAVSAGGAAAPAPTTPSGGMRVATAPGQVLAYGAVLYPLPADAVAGRLTFDITASQGTVNLLACPTKTTSWPAGDDQPLSDAPAYDCSTTRAAGAISADGTTVSFALATLPVGLLSVAIVPDVSAASTTPDQPFSVDLDKPGASSLQVTTGGGSLPQEFMPAAPPAAFQSTSTPGRPLGVPKLPAPTTTTQAAPSGTGTAPQVATSAPPAAPQLAAETHRSAAGTIGSVIGALCLVAAFLFWGLGRGLLGGKIEPLSMPVRSSES